jgi:hypothetical protein
MGRTTKLALYAAIEDFKEDLGKVAGEFEQDHPGTALKISFEVATALGTEKIKVTIAGPFHQQTLPGMEPPADDQVRRWWNEEHGNSN